MNPLTEAFLRCMILIMKNVLALGYASVIVASSLIWGGCSAAGDEPAPNALSFQIQDAAAWRVFDAASAGLFKHTGAQAVSSIRGTTVHTGPQPADRSTSCADTTVKFLRESMTIISVDIALYLPVPERCYDDPTYTLMHEMTHAARAWEGLAVTNAEQIDDHATAGFFRSEAGDPRFDASTLSKFCEAVPCTQFETE